MNRIAKRLAVSGSLVAAVVAALVAVVVWGGSGGHEVGTDEAARRLGDATTAPSSTPAGAGSLVLPPVGVYRYVGGGTDALSSPPKEQTEGPDMPATVEHRADGCWTFRIDYHSNHWQTWDYCIDGEGRLVEEGGSTFQRWDFGVFVQESTTTFACEESVTVDPAAAPGDEWTQTCGSVGVDPASTSAGPYELVGFESLTIGGRQVDAVHHRRTRTMSGGQRGTEVSDVWFRRSDGLPLRNERRIEVGTDTVIGEVRYTEDAHFELTSTDPVS